MILVLLHTYVFSHENCICELVDKRSLATKRSAGVALMGESESIAVRWPSLWSHSEPESDVNRSPKHYFYELPNIGSKTWRERRLGPEGEKQGRVKKETDALWMAFLIFINWKRCYSGVTVSPLRRSVASCKIFMHIESRIQRVQLQVRLSRAAGCNERS